MTILMGVIKLRYRRLAAAALLVLAMAPPVTGQSTRPPAYGWRSDASFGSLSLLQPVQAFYGSRPVPAASGWQSYPSFTPAGLYQPAPEGTNGSRSGGGAGTPAASQSTASSSTSSTSNRSGTRVRYASGNKQQTDSITSGTFTFWNSDLYIDGVVDFPVPGRVKIAENNSAMPEDRVYFVYKHFHNALNTSIGDGAGTTLGNRNFSIDRYVAGFEKTFGDRQWSVELRMPLTGTAQNTFDEGLSSDAAGIGNLAITVKRLFYESETLAIAAGLAVSLPTGDDATFFLGNEVFTLRNQAPHLLPFAMFVSAPTEITFYRGALQLDIPATANQFDVRDTSVGAAVTDLGDVRDQTLLYAGLSAGCWLYRSPESPLLSGLATAVDLQYTASVNGADTDFGNTSDTRFAIGSSADGLSVLNLTFGLYANFANRTTVYTGAVFPLTDGVNRLFDAEVQFAANYAF